MSEFLGAGRPQFNGLKKIVGSAALSVWISVAPSSAQDVIEAEQLLNADQTNGRRAFLNCRKCHKLKEGARSVQGPNLWNVFGRKVGTREDFNYSSALRKAEFVWTADKLNEWLTKPKDFLPGTLMSFAGLPNKEQRVDLIAYMMNATGYSIEAVAKLNTAESEGEGTQ